MSSTVTAVPPPDSAERKRALDARRSVLVEAPAGSGKTDLLTRRFLRLLSEVDEPGQIVAITFTKAAAAEMRHRILAEIEKAAAREGKLEGADELSMEALAARALERSQELDWNLIDLPGQLRISTIDAFCRELALQRPLLTDLSGGLDIFEDPSELYRRAARKTLEQIDTAKPELRSAIATLLRWRDNGWQEMENLLIEMLAKRDRWMQEFVFAHELNRDELRERLERPFARAVRKRLEELSALLDRVPHARREALELARFACANTDGKLHGDLAELVEFPEAPFDVEMLDDARQACECLAGLLLTKDGAFRKSIDIRLGFPPDRKQEKERLRELISDLKSVPGLESALADVCALPPARYTEDDWEIVRACFVLLRWAAGQLKVEFAEAGAVDYTEVAQIAMQVLGWEEEIPDEGTLAAAEDIRHLLVDEFQDTSRRQHQLLSRLIAAWPEREGRTCFVVGDPMQSIYFFRDADAELFPQVRDGGLNVAGDRPFAFDHAPLRTNFRTAPSLVEHLNRFFEAVFAGDDGSGVRFTKAESPKSSSPGPVLLKAGARIDAHFEFVPCAMKGAGSSNTQQKERVQKERSAAREAQTSQIVELIRSRVGLMETARAAGKKYRIAVLGRARTALTPIAEALRAAEIPFGAIELEKLRDRPEVMDALAIARALLNPHDRLAWLGLLRAPWCGLSLADLHTLTSADDLELQRRGMRELIAQRAEMLTEQGSAAARRLLRAIEAAEAWRSARPGASLGTWAEQAWLMLGGADCVDEAGWANVDLLWRCLDKLPEGDADVSGSALDAALDKLTALPDPRASGECGVQLMTIHKAKGLEFEVVIVPELQAGAGRSRPGLLSWLERGLPEPDDESDVTEFLVAPIPSKGTDRGRAKAWVDREYRKREKQEARRVLYVAATRARDELHVFARPEYKTEAGGVLSLSEPQESLLKTAWPALEEEARRRFEEWLQSKPAEAGELNSVAAAAGNVIEMPAAQKPAVLRRLPANYRIGERVNPRRSQETISGLSAEPFYGRHEGGLLSRALGIAVHSVFEDLARLRATQDWEIAQQSIKTTELRLTAQMRALGLDPAQAARTAAKALETAIGALQDPMARWVLSPHADAGSEVRWAGVAGGGVHAVRVDRVFRAGLEPGSEGCDAWWIVDYKTAHAEDIDAERALPELRALFAPQLDAYARVLRGLHGTDAVIRAGLYYPRMKQFDWWEL